MNINKNNTEYATGVFDNNDLEDYWCFDINNSVSEQWVAHLQECEGDEGGYHDNCWEDQPDDDTWYGCSYDENKKKIVEDENAEFVCVQRGATYQVVRSKWVISGMKLCFQGCYPGFQAHTCEGNGDLVAWSLPPDCLREDLRKYVREV